MFNSFSQNNIDEYLSKLCPNYNMLEEANSFFFFIKNMKFLSTIFVIASILTVLFFIFLCFFYQKTKKEKHHLFLLRKKIKEIGEEKKDNHHMISSYNLLLKEYIGKYNKYDVDQLYGIEWLSFLDAYSNTHFFTKGHGRFLGFYYEKKICSFDAKKEISKGVYFIIKKIILSR